MAHAECMEKQLNDMEQDMRQLMTGMLDTCLICGHCCVDGKPLYRPNEKYMEYCDECDAQCSEFVWRGRTVEIMRQHLKE